MSLKIDVDTVEAILLADGWHNVAGNSFDLDAYEFFHGKRRLFSGGKGGTPSMGATWTDGDGTEFSCPITAILAVKISRKG